MRVVMVLEVIIGLILLCGILSSCECSVLRVVLSWVCVFDVIQMVFCLFFFLILNVRCFLLVINCWVHYDKLGLVLCCFLYCGILVYDVVVVQCDWFVCYFWFVCIVECGF